MEEGLKSSIFSRYFHHKTPWCGHPSQIGHSSFKKILRCNFPWPLFDNIDFGLNNTYKLTLNSVLSVI
jgi:hypothetical protein